MTQVKKTSALLVVATVGLLSFYNSCQNPARISKSDITVTGNPMGTAAFRISSAVCERLAECRSEISPDQCRSGVFASGGVDTQLGLPSGSYNQVAFIDQAEVTGLLPADQTATQTCLTRIESLNCQDSTVQSAYDPNAANPFANSAKMIPNDSSCTAIYLPKVKAFPTAEGFGQDSVGGRGGRIIHVTNLNDSGAGSFREAVTATGPRTVVFDVSGTITLQSDIGIVGESMSYLTVAGQTSPGGIQLKGPDHGLSINSGVHDVIIRYLRVRPGGPASTGESGNSLIVWDNAYRVVIDHCSMEWGNSTQSMVQGDSREVTYQWNIIAEGTDTPSMSGATGYSMAIGGINTTASIHHNLIAHSAQWNPGILSSKVADIRNNLIYNWAGNNGVTWGDYSAAKSAFGNLINNHFIPGADTTSPIYIWVGNGGPTRLDGTAADRGGTKIYTEGNWGSNCPSGCADDWDNEVHNLDFYASGIISSSDLASAAQFRSLSAYPVPPVTTEATGDLKAKVLTSVGASKPSRDSADLKVVNDVLNGTGSIAAIGNGGPWPTLSGGPAPLDTDQDGMPDAWETAHSLNPTNASDATSIAPNGYTAIENYLNELAGDL